MNEYGSKAAEAFKTGRETVADTLDDAGSRLEETARAGDTASALGTPVERIAKPIDLQLLFDTVARFCTPRDR